MVFVRFNRLRWIWVYCAICILLYIFKDSILFVTLYGFLSTEMYIYTVYIFIQTTIRLVPPSARNIVVGVHLSNSSETFKV